MRRLTPNRNPSPSSGELRNLRNKRDIAPSHVRPPRKKWVRLPSSFFASTLSPSVLSFNIFCMSDDDLDDFKLDLGTPLSFTSISSSVSHPVAATPSSLLHLSPQLHDRSRHSVTSSPPSSPTLVVPSSPNLHAHFPFPSPSHEFFPLWSPALTSPSSFTLDNRPLLCVNVDHLEPTNNNFSSPILATPPSPLGLPGSYNTWARRMSLSSNSPGKAKSKARESVEGELFLPPPLLDNTDTTATRKSFEGLLGLRSARQAEKDRIEHEKLYALGRPPPLRFPQSLFQTFRKLVLVLGPPGGYEYDRSKRVKGEGEGIASARRRAQRAESALKVHDYGAKIGGEMAGRLRRKISYRDDPVPTSTPSVAPPSCEQETTRIGHRKPSLLSPSLGSVTSKTAYFPTETVDSPLPTTVARLVEFVSWFLIGSFDDASLNSLGGLVGCAVHLVGFTFFVLSHAVSLTASSVRTLRSFSIFFYWMTLNLCGRTEISQAVIAYWRTCRREWNRVCSEEEGGKGLTAWSVVRGLVELSALHSMTRERWLMEELNLLNIKPLEEPTNSGLSGSQQSPVKVKRSNSSRNRHPRPSFVMDQNRTSFRWNRSEEEEEEEEEADGLVVTSRAGSLLEGTLIASPDNARSRSRRSRSTLSPNLVPVVVPEPLIQGQGDPLDVDEIISLLKRCGRLSTAAYGLQTYIVSPPTPLLTPSGATLPHRLFAHLGGIKDYRNVLHVALQKNRSDDSNTETYAPTFYLLRDDARRQVIVVFRGTQSLADIKTDLEGDFVPLSLPRPPFNSEAIPETSSYRVHAGILAAARHLLDPTHSPLFSKLVASLEETDYDLLLAGHSLGSALASTVALLISHYDTTTERWLTSVESGLPPERSIRAVTFAHPTTLNAPLAARCAIGTPPLVLSVSLASDVITRAGLPQLKELRRMLGRLDLARRKDSRIMSDWWEWRSLTSKENQKRGLDEGSRRETVRTVEETAWRRRLEITHNHSDALESDSAIPAGKTYHLDQLPKREEDGSRGKADELDNGDNGELRLGLYEVRDPTRFYHAPLLLSDMIRSHLPKEYLEAVESL
ncbi:lipase family protein [Sporobolomyces salmoneus]|uniref:lipase family protein n=1 Tax=Sporobolomyces salmoneus TaxID=183962 RepID=UPI00316DD71C